MVDFSIGIRSSSVLHDNAVVAVLAAYDIRRAVGLALKLLLVADTKNGRRAVRATRSDFISLQMPFGKKYRKLKIVCHPEVELGSSNPGALGINTN